MRLKHLLNGGLFEPRHEMKIDVYDGVGEIEVGIVGVGKSHSTHAQLAIVEKRGTCAAVDAIVSPGLNTVYIEGPK